MARAGEAVGRLVLRGRVEAVRALAIRRYSGCAAALLATVRTSAGETMSFAGETVREMFEEPGVALASRRRSIFEGAIETFCLTQTIFAGIRAVPALVLLIIIFSIPATVTVGVLRSSTGETIGSRLLVTIIANLTLASRILLSIVTETF